jgi:hypothetical protein
VRSAGPPGSAPRLSRQQLAAIDQAVRQGGRAHGFDTDHWTLVRVTAVIERLTGSRHQSGHTPVIRHQLKRKRVSLAPAPCYGSRGGGTQLTFHHRATPTTATPSPRSPRPSVASNASVAPTPSGRLRRPWLALARAVGVVEGQSELLAGQAGMPSPAPAQAPKPSAPVDA